MIFMIFSKCLKTLWQAQFVDLFVGNNVIYGGESRLHSCTYVRETISKMD